MKNLFIILIFLSVFTSCKNSSEKRPPIPQNVEKASPEVLKKKVDKQAGLIELKSLDSSFVYDIRYATSNNFVHKKMYPCPKCYLRPVVAQAMYKIQQELMQRGFRLKFFDCYRPGKIQWQLWRIKPDPHYVADPRKGSMHNRGVAVDVTIVDQNGKELDMGTPFDYFGKKAYHSYQKLPDTVLKNRLFLKNLMHKYHMEPITSEWWHYSYREKDFPIENWVWTCP